MNTASQQTRCKCVPRPAQSDLCPVCGEHVTLTGKTTNGRLIGSCGDAFTRERWEECPNCGGEVLTPIDVLRLGTIKIGLEAEMNGYRLTAKAPRCFKIIEIEFGIKAKRSAQGKRAAYEEFCNLFGFEPKTDKGATKGGVA